MIALALLPGPATAAPGIKDTVEWITDKLIKNGARQRVGDYKGDVYYAATVRASADHCRLVVVTTFEMAGDTHRTTFTVPMKDLKNIERKPFSPGSQASPMLHIYTHRKTIRMQQTDQFGRSEQWTDGIFMPFSFNREADIFARMTTALDNFSRLAKDNAACRSKETF
jgi:hypothetical protein